MLRVATITITLSALIWSVVPLFGEEEKQTATSKESGETTELSPRQALKIHFDDHSPPLGSALSDVLAMDADGNEFRLSGLKGHYSVIVFGCLT
jgi:cytochrome oxidase Cu insertion factor (SCO1/SenC/PrrC family)